MSLPLKRHGWPGDEPDLKKKCIRKEDDVYLFDSGRRWVKPYYFDFVAHAKQRWWGKNLLDVYQKEFVAYSQEYYVS